VKRGARNPAAHLTATTYSHAERERGGQRPSSPPSAALNRRQATLFEPTTSPLPDGNRLLEKHNAGFFPALPILSPRLPWHPDGNRLLEKHNAGFFPALSFLSPRLPWHPDGNRLLENIMRDFFPHCPFFRAQGCCRRGCRAGRDAEGCDGRAWRVTINPISEGATGARGSNGLRAHAHLSGLFRLIDDAAGDADVDEEAFEAREVRRSAAVEGVAHGVGDHH
jgi:hypothetical protein